jgi:hypothetical protein
MIPASAGNIVLIVITLARPRVDENYGMCVNQDVRDKPAHIFYRLQHNDHNGHAHVYHILKHIQDRLLRISLC